MRDQVRGKRVAIIGRAGSLYRTKNGRLIDSFETVIRINWVLPISDEDAPHTGKRTDLVYHCKRAKQARIQATQRGIKTVQSSGKARRRLAEEYFQNPKKLRPTTGFLCIWEALNAGAIEIGLFGFDFFRSGHVQDREPDGDDYSKPLAWAHSPHQERRALGLLIQKFPTILKPDQVLREALR